MKYLPQGRDIHSDGKARKPELARRLAERLNLSKKAQQLQEQIKQSRMVTFDEIVDCFQLMREEIECRTKLLELDRGGFGMDGKEPNGADENKDRIIEVQNNMIKFLRNKVKYRGKILERDKLVDLASGCRFSSTSKINYTKLGRALGVSNHAARRMCRLNRIQ